MPKEGKMVEFNAYIKTQRHSIVISVKFKAIHLKCLGKKRTTTTIQKHKMMNFVNYVKVLDNIPVDRWKISIFHKHRLYTENLILIGIGKVYICSGWLQICDYSMGTLQMRNVWGIL